MTARRPLPASVALALFLSLGLFAVLAPLAPFAPAGGLVVPDLLYCLVIAWVVRRPATAPLWAVVLLGLFGDLMLARPVGLGALGLVMISEWFRRRGYLFHSAPFPFEWLVAGLGFAAMLAGIRLVLAVTFAGGPGAGVLLSYLVATVLAYPLVVLGIVWCLGLRAPRAQAFGNPPARLR
ncbi:MAG: rod shape-determining protein MreD [Amaricoccus sp.]